MSGSESPSSPSARLSRPTAIRWLLLLLMLLALARLVWRWDARNLWWDESLSLQRAESPLAALLVGSFSFDDGAAVVNSTDQHPFVYFLLLGGLIRLAGESDLVLRFPSAAAATLLVPMSWALARLLERRRAVPPGAALWAALFAALNPFFLWYGREARMYTLVPFFALLSVYWLLRWTTAAPGARLRRYLVYYAGATLLLLGTHFLSFLILPIHAGLLFVHLAERNRRRALLVAAAVLAGGLVFGLAAAGWILRGMGSGANFSFVSLPIMAADLLNAFSLGLSVDIAQVRWLNYLFGAVAVIGALWAARRSREAWLLPALVIAPVLLLYAIQYIQPTYMNARHMSLISGAFGLLVAAGCAALWQRRRWAGALVGLALIGGMVFSTVNYFTSPANTRDNFARVGADLAAALQPGDAVVLLPAHMVRLYQHYLPLAELEAATLERAASSPAPLRGWAALPELHGSLEDTQARLAEVLANYRRVWLVASGMVPLSPHQAETRAWLEEHAFLARDLKYESNTDLTLQLFLPQPPVLPELPASVAQRATVTFGDLIRLDGYEIGEPLTPASATPVTLYWQPLEKIERRYKYILRLISVAEDGSARELAATEQEPYHGSLPTTWWAPGPEIFEYSGLPPAARFDGPLSSLRLAIQMYDAETLEKLPITAVSGGAVLVDEHTAWLPFER